MIGWEYPPRITGGLGIACRGIARSLARRGHQVDFLLPRCEGGEMGDEGVRVFGPEPVLFTVEELREYTLHLQRFQAGSTPSPYESAAVRPADAGGAETAVVAESIPVLSPEGLSAEYADGFLRGGYGDHIYKEIHAFARLAGLLVQKKPYDVIHAHDWMTFPAARAAAAASGLPLVCHVHATEFDRSGEHVNQYIYDLERETLQACDQIITVSNYTRQILIERYGIPAGKITPVHNAVEFELPQPASSAASSQAEAGPEAAGPAPRERIVLFLGRITFQKGPDYFVRAARRVVERLGGRGVRFVMAGTGDMYARMIELAADLGVGRYFHYTGFLDREQVRRIYEMSDLYVMPSVSEPFGISPLEAMVHGVPVIVSKQSGVSEVIANCIKVDFWDVEALADAIVQVLEGGQDRDRLQAGAREEVRSITWATAATRIEAVYRHLVPKYSLQIVQETP